MTLRKAESFDHLAAVDLQRKWTVYNDAATTSITATNARYGLSFTSNHYSSGVSQTFDSQATWIVGFGFRCADYPGTTRALLTFLDTAVTHMELRIDSAGHLIAARNGTTLGTGTAVIALNTWYYIEMKVTINDSTGVAVVKVNGVTDINLSGQDTRNAGNSTANVVQFGLSTNSGSGHSFWLDDITICDANGAVNNDFLGDVRVEALFTSGNGNYSQMSGSDGNSTDNYLLVDDPTGNGDTDYVSDSTSGHIDSYAMTNLTATAGTIVGVQTCLWARKDDAGTRGLKPFFRISSTDYARTTVNLKDSYVVEQAIEELSPATSSAWTISELNGLEFGQKIP